MGVRALIIERPGNAIIASTDTPRAGPGEVAIEVIAGGICGTDVEIYHGNMSYFTNGAAQYPVIPCHEWVGLVREVGENGGFMPGDRVVGEVSIGCLACSVCMTGNYHRCATRTETGILNRQGGFAERIVLPVAFVHKIAPHVPLASAALVEPTAVAFNGVRRAGVSPMDAVAIIGDGPIGLLLLQVAKLFGVHRVALIGAAERRLALAREIGADGVLDAREGDLELRMREIFGGSRPNVVFEASGNPDAVRSGIELVAPGGRVVLQGFCGGQRIDRVDSDAIIVNDVTIIGALGSPGIWPEVIRLIESGRLDPSVIVTDELPVSAFEEAIRRVETREAVKVLLRTDTADQWQ
jgi:2-desacetyl-2-hydroxyethyl bacteriochlorophyllide A dehydrogenase